MLIEDAITKLADGGAAPLVADLIAERLDVKPDLVLGALETMPDDPATALCRAAGLSVDAFSAVLRMRRRHQRGAIGPQEALGAFRRLPMEAARKLARTMAAEHD